MLKLNLPGPVIVFDTETGGLNPTEEISWSLDESTYTVGNVVQGRLHKLSSPILEIGAVVLDPLNFEEVDEFHIICGKEEKEDFKHFLSRCTDEALKVNGFKDRLDELERAKPLSEGLKSFVSWIKKAEEEYNGWAIPCGQNVKFDIEMVNSACKRLGINYQIKSHPLELTSYSQLYFSMQDTPTVANYRLTTVAQALGISTKNAHQALSDVKMTAECIRRMFNKFCS